MLYAFFIPKKKKNKILFGMKNNNSKSNNNKNNKGQRIKGQISKSFKRE